MAERSEPPEETAENLCRCLPIRVTSQDVERYSNTVKLLSRIASDYISRDGLVRSTQDQLDKAKDQLKEAKYFYFQQKVLFAELKELLLDVERDKVSSESVRLTGNPELYDMLQQCVTTVTAAHHIALPPTEHVGSKEASILGIKSEHLRQIDPRQGALQQHLQAIQQSIIPELESRLKDKCERLVEYHNVPKESSHNGKSRGLAFAKAAQLPAIIEAELKQLQDQEETIQKQKQQAEEKFWEYYYSLCKSLDMSVELLRDHRLKREPERDKLTCDWLTARCDALCLKLAVIKGELLKETYSPQAVAALRKIKHELDESLNRSHSERQHLQQSLQTYRSVGSGFSSLVDEYSQLQEAIKNKLWALQELSQIGDGKSSWQMKDTSLP